MMVLLRINICSLQIIRAVILNNSMNFFPFFKKNDRKYTVILCSNKATEQKKNEMFFDIAHKISRIANIQSFSFLQNKC